MAGIIPKPEPPCFEEEDAEWHIKRPSTAQRKQAVNDTAGYVGKERNLTTVFRSFHYKADRAERRRAWHVSKKWKERMLPKLPWQVGKQPVDPRVDTTHLKRCKSPEAMERHMLAEAARGDGPAQIPVEEIEEEAAMCADGAPVGEVGEEADLLAALGDGGMPGLEELLGTANAEADALCAIAEQGGGAARSMTKADWIAKHGNAEGFDEYDFDGDGIVDIDEVAMKDDQESEWYDKNPIYKDAIFGGNKSKQWHDVTGLPLIRHDDDGNMPVGAAPPPLMVQPDGEPLECQPLELQLETEAKNHNQLLKVLVDDRFSLPMKFHVPEPEIAVNNGKKVKKKSLAERTKNKYNKAGKGPLMLPPSKPLSKGLSQEQQRMEQNRMLRQMTEDEFGRETERRMMLATIANPQKRLLLHRYFEEQRAIAAKEINTMVEACEHAVLSDLGLTKGVDRRGVNFQLEKETPLYFPDTNAGPPVHDPYALTPSQNQKLRELKAKNRPRAKSSH